MNLLQLKSELNRLKETGYLPTLRKGPTGIGYTLEKALNLPENNISIPDIGGRIELKATRRNAGSLITLFTFNRGVWQIPQKQVILDYGYTSKKDRMDLYCLVRVGDINPQGLTLSVDEQQNEVCLIHSVSGTLIAKWSMYVIVGRFLNKTERLLLIVADSRKNEQNREEFLFREAYLLMEPNPQRFLEAFKSGSVAIDIRMHLKRNMAVRNHGTGFRIREIDIPLLYGDKRQLL